MFDLGQTVPLALNNGPAGSVTCTITLPDGTTASPAVVGASPNFTASYVSVQAGRHSVVWSATGFSFTDVFNVGAAHGAALVSLAEVKSILNITVSTYDDELRGFIAGATPVIEFYTGPIIQQTVDQWYDGGTDRIMLLKAPVVSVTSVTETFGANVIRTLVYQPLDGITPVDAFGYTIDNMTGTLIRRVSGIAAPFAAGKRNVHVVYVAGRTDVPYNIQEATKELIRVNWQPKQGGNRAGYTQQQGVDGLNVDGALRMGYFVPNRVIEQLQPSQHAWGIA